jgi:hypothetical protein
MDYSTEVLNILPRKLNKTRVYYGIELEVEAQNGDRGYAAMRVKEEIGERYCICKYDGSLHSERGFEIVTTPETLNKHRSLWEGFLDRLPIPLASWDTHGRCGMHVNISREPLSQLTISKLVVFVNALDNRDFMVSLAGRNSCWGEFANNKKLSNGHKLNPNRGSAVNLQNDERVEIRIFKGTLDKLGFFKNLEFCECAIRYCRIAGNKELSIAQFLTWFRTVRKEYKYLDEWLVREMHLASRSVKTNGKSIKTEGSVS